MELQPYAHDEVGPLGSPGSKGHMILRQEAADVFWGELHPDMRPKCIQTAGGEVIVEIPQYGRECDRLDPDLVGPGDQAIPCTIPRRIIVADDIEPAQMCRKEEGCEMSG